MYLKNRISEIRSKKDVIILVDEIELNPDLLIELFSLLEQRLIRQSLYSSWVLCHLAESCPELVSPYSQNILSLFENTPHLGANRNLMRCFMEIDIPENVMSPLLDKCLEFINDSKQPVAVKAFSLQTFARIVLKEPDLANELNLAMTNLYFYKSPAIHGTMKKIRKMMKKNNISI